MDSNFSFSVRTLPNGGLLLCSPDGAPVLVDASGRIRLDKNNQPMTYTGTSPAIEAAKQSKENRVDLADYFEVLSVLYQPRLNLRSQQLELNGSEIGEEEFEALHVACLRDNQLQFKKGDMQAVIRAIARSAAYDPVHTYLSSLGVEGGPVLDDEEWDQIAVLTLGLADSWSRTVVQKFLLAAVARVMEPGCQVHQCLILHGRQGLGKSTFFRVLGGDFFSDSMGNLDEKKDDLMIMHRTWINEWSEADQIFVGANKAEKIKRFVSASDDSFRSPYGRTTQKWLRRSVLCGTTNRDDWANDPSGNRRFPVLSPKEINTQWLTEHRDRVWARAVVEYRRGRRWWFEEEEELLISRQAANYTPDDPVAERLLNQLQVAPGRWFSTQELAMLALDWEQKECTKKSLGSLARSLQALATSCVTSDRRSHTPLNPSHGLKGTKKVWAYIPDQHASTQ